MSIPALRLLKGFLGLTFSSGSARQVAWSAEIRWPRLRAELYSGGCLEYRVDMRQQIGTTWTGWGAVGTVRPALAIQSRRA